MADIQRPLTESRYAGIDPEVDVSQMRQSSAFILTQAKRRLSALVPSAMVLPRMIFAAACGRRPIHFRRESLPRVVRRTQRGVSVRHIKCTRLR